MSTQEAPCSIRTLSEINYDLRGSIFLEDHLSSLLHLKKVLHFLTNPFYTSGCLVVKRAMSMSLHHLPLMYADHFSSASLSLRGQANALVEQLSLLLKLKNSLKFNSTLSTNLVHWSESIDCCLRKLRCNLQRGTSCWCQPGQPIRAHRKGNCYKKHTINLLQKRLQTCK